MGFGGGGAVHDSVAAAKIGRDDFPTRPRRANDAGTAPLVTVQTCGDLRTIRRVVEGQPSTESPPQTVPVPSNVNSCPLAHLLRTVVRRAIISYRAAFTRQDRPRNPAAGDLPMTVTAGHPDRPPPAPVPPGAARRRPGRGRCPGVGPLRQHQPGLRDSVASLRRLVREVGLVSLPAEPLTVARYLAVRAGDGASIATMRLASSAIAKAHEWAKLESPGRDPGVRASLKGWGRRLAKPQRQSGALTADVLAVIRLTAVQPRKARPRHRDARAGCGKGEVRRGPGRRAVGWWAEALRGFVSHLG